MTKVDLRQQANTREVILTTFVLLALFFVFLRMASGPLSTKTSAIKEEIQQLKQEEESLSIETRALAQDRKSTTTDMVETPNAKLRILKGELFPVIDQMSGLLLEVTSPHFKQGVIIDSFASGEPQDRGRYTMTPLSFKLHGPFGRLLDFINSIDELVSLISVDSVRMMTDPMVAGTMNLELSASFYNVEGIHAKTMLP